MDILAHGLWVGLGLAAASTRRPLPRRTVAATLAMAVVPDLAQLLPLLGLAVSEPDGLTLLRGYAMATPDTEPILPPAVAMVSHHLHCALHSAVVAGLATAAIALATRSFWLPLAGWWAHIVIDVFTHSADFYPAPVLYPFTQRGFDGVAWNTPVFMVANYAALAAAAIALLAWRRLRRR